MLDDKYKWAISKLVSMDGVIRGIAKLQLVPARISLTAVLKFHNFAAKHRSE